ncbi:MAG: hypothetical protein WCK15_23400, partial [Pirellula sp.]
LTVKRNAFGKVLKQQAVTRRVTIAYPMENAPFAERKATLVHRHKVRSGARGRKRITCTSI